MNKKTCLSVEEKAKKERKQLWIINSLVAFLLFLFLSNPVFAEGETATAITLEPISSLVLSIISSCVVMGVVFKAAKEWQNGSTGKMVIAIVIGMFMFWFASSPTTVLNKGNDIFSGIFGG